MFELIAGDIKFKQDWFLSQKSWFVKNVRVFADPGTIASICFRFGSWTRRIRFAPLRWLMRIPYLILKTFVVLGFGIYIPSSAKIGKGFTIHNFSGIFICEADMGENVIVFQGVTIGHLRGQPAPPKIGNNVMIAAGAKVLGSITIGNNVVIGANSVVINDIPDNCTVMGNPARIISRETNWMSDKIAGNAENNY